MTHVLFINVHKCFDQGISLEGDEEFGLGKIDDDESVIEEVMFEGEEEVQRLEASFDEILISNRLTLEGLRGIFMFMVIYDHFHNPLVPISSAFAGNINLFMIMTGFTTPLQLRETPVFVKRSSEDKSTLDDNRPLNSSEPSSIAVKVRPSFKIIPFIISRMVGLYPILWLALLLDITGQLKNPSKESETTQAICQTLYWLALQSWWRPACLYYGPNYLLYASLLFCVFLLYSLIRKGWMAIQNVAMEWASKDINPVTLKAHVGLEEGKIKICHVPDVADFFMNVSNFFFLIYIFLQYFLYYSFEFVVMVYFIILSSCISEQ